MEREPEWTPDQTAIVRAVEAYDRMVGSHGQPLDEATADEANPNNRNGTYRYLAGVLTTRPDGTLFRIPVTDYARKAELDAEEMFRKGAGENANFNGQFWPVERVEREPRQ